MTRMVLLYDRPILLTITITITIAAIIVVCFAFAFSPSPPRLAALTEKEWGQVENQQQKKHFKLLKVWKVSA